MPRKPRSEKTPIQLWVADGRAALQAKRQMSAKQAVALIAELTNVTEDTARGWESRGAPNEDAVRVLEGLFATKAPGRGRGQEAPDLASALLANATALQDLAKELEASRLDREKMEERVRALEAAVRLLAQPGGGELQGPSFPLVTTR